MIKKIITHNGIFHADDVMSVALIHELIDESIPVERTRKVSTADVVDPNVWVIDVNGMFNPAQGLFDHHQDGNLPASCMMILQHMPMRSDVYLELYDVINVISTIDCKGPTEYDGFQFNTLIKSFNALENGFEVAVGVARNYIRACVATADKATDSQRIWDNGLNIGEHIKVCDAFPVHWKRYGEQPILVYPNDGKWNVLTINSLTMPLLSTGKQDFMHANAFLAIFKDKSDAIACAQKSVVNAFA